MKKIQKLIYDHVAMSVDPLVVAETLLKHYPEYSYLGVAYRAIPMWDKKEDYDPALNKPGTSWSISPEGREYYMYHLGESPDRFIMLEANVLGLCFVRLIHEQFSHLAGVVDRFKKEDEVIATEIIEILSEKEQKA